MKLTLVIPGRDSGEAEEATRLEDLATQYLGRLPTGGFTCSICNKVSKDCYAGMASVTSIQNTFPQSMVTHAGFVGTIARARQHWLVMCQFITEIDENTMLALTAL